MNNTLDIIAKLSSEVSTPVPYRAPRTWAWRVFGALMLYALAATVFMGERADIAAQFTRPLFVTELALLVILLLTSLLATLLSFYPDALQKPKLLQLPLYALLAFFLFFLGQFFVPTDDRMLLPTHAPHGSECSICIAALAGLPSVMLFAMLRRGASVRPLQAGVFAVLTSATLGAIILRLCEPNDTPAHLLIWHYVPTLAFAAIGALIGKHCLKW